MVWERRTEDPSHGEDVGKKEVSRWEDVTEVVVRAVSGGCVFVGGGTQKTVAGLCGQSGPEEESFAAVHGLDVYSYGMTTWPGIKAWKGRWVSVCTLAWRAAEGPEAEKSGCALG